MKVRAVDFVMYNVSDIKKSMDFYGNVLGLKYLPDSSSPDEGFAEYEAGNVTIDLVSFDKASIGKGAAVALSVDDVKKTLSELTKKGVKVAQEFYETPVCFGAGILDPDGNKISIHHRKDGTAG